MLNYLNNGFCTIGSWTFSKCLLKALQLLLGANDSQKHLSSFAMLHPTLVHGIWLKGHENTYLVSLAMSCSCHTDRIQVFRWKGNNSIMICLTCPFLPSSFLPPFSSFLVSTRDSAYKWTMARPYPEQWPKAYRKWPRRAAGCHQVGTTGSRSTISSSWPRTPLKSPCKDWLRKQSGLGQWLPASPLSTEDQPKLTLRDSPILQKASLLG